MYPNLYYVFKSWFGVSWEFLKIFNTFGLMVAAAFFVAAVVITAELKRREALGLLLPLEETIVVGKPASIAELLLNGILGFAFGAKFLGLILNKPANVDAQSYIFSLQGNIVAGIVVGGLMAYLKWNEKNKQKLATPENKRVRIKPHERVGDIVVIALVFGILGAKLFDNFEHWDRFMEDPLGQLFSISGLTFYGGLILAAIAVCLFAYRKRISIPHLVDSAAPCLMIAYAVGRIGCQVAGDGDWGIYNSAYVNDENNKVIAANAGDFNKGLEKNSTYFLQGLVADANGKMVQTGDKPFATLQDVPHKYWKGPSFLPTWLFAYNYPQNVNNEGIPMAGVTEEHYSVLPMPVFPTPLYETIICSLLFLFLWLIRRKITTPLVIFGFYLILNGVERFLIELVRVNKQYDMGSFNLSQAQQIAAMLMIAGVACIIGAKLYFKNNK
jgi:phosphatidylglycerol---prolipoprotein diacylglyceryl transferase